MPFEIQPPELLLPEPSATGTVGGELSSVTSEALDELMLSRLAVAWLLPTCLWTRREYAPFIASSCSCVPRSTMRPLLTTQIQSAPRTVESLCATSRVVLSLINRSMASCTTCSLSASSALLVKLGK